MDHFGVDPIKLENYLKENTFIRNKKCINKNTKKVIEPYLVHVWTSFKISEILLLENTILKLLRMLLKLLVAYKGKHVGTFGDIGILSFNGNKIVTAGVGGAIVTNSKKFAIHSKHLTTTAKVSHRWDFIHDEIGYNYRLSNINAALGISQLKNYQNILLIKKIVL